MRWPRPTTRGWMLAVLGLALALGLGLPALEVYREDEVHMHLFLRPVPRPDLSNYPFEAVDGLPSHVYARDHAVRTPFLPRYRLRLLGRDWKRRPACGDGRGRLEEICEFARPEIRTDPKCPDFDLIADSPALVASPPGDLYRVLVGPGPVSSRE